MSLLTKAFGTKSDREIKTLWPIVKEIKQIAESIKSKSDEDLIQRTNEMRSEVITVREKVEQELSGKRIDKDEAVIADAEACITKCENAIKGCRKVKTTAGSLGRRGKLLKELASEGPETFMNKMATKAKKAARKVRRKNGK